MLDSQKTQLYSIHKTPTSWKTSIYRKKTSSTIFYTITPYP